MMMPPGELGGPPDVICHEQNGRPPMIEVREGAAERREKTTWEHTQSWNFKDFATFSGWTGGYYSWFYGYL